MRTVRGAVDAAEMERFLETFLYGAEAFVVDEIVRVDREARAIVAVMDTARPLPYGRLQRPGDHHPAHVPAADMLQATGCLGCLHAWFFHGCRWDEGWAGFGNRIHRADFKRLARLGPPLRLESREARTRVGPARIVMRCEFRFFQDDALVYSGDQSAMFVRQHR